MKILLASTTLIPGPILYKIYNAICSQNVNFVIGLAKQRVNISIVIATFSFTMLGFLAAIITVLFGVTKSQAFQQYRRKGYFDLLIFVYWFAILNLVATFILSILGFSNNFFPLLFKSMLMSTVNNIFQLCIITFIILGLVRKSANEP